MAWYFVVQPSGKFARFSDVVDEFTHINLNEVEALALGRDLCGIAVASKKIEAAKNEPKRYAEVVLKMKRIHGEDEVLDILEDIT